MKYIKKFESMEISREEILDFFDYDADNLLEINSIEFYKNNDSLKSREGYAILHKLSKDWQLIPKNLFNDTKLEKKLKECLEFCIIKINIYHPKMVRGASFAYENFIKKIIQKKCERIYNGYDIECFISMSRVNPYENPIAEVSVILI